MKKIAAVNRELFGKLWIAVIPILLASLGFNGYTEYEKRQAVPAVKIDVVVESTEIPKDYSLDIKAAIAVYNAQHIRDYH